MRIRDKSGLFLLFLVLLASLSFAQFRIIPDKTTFENVQGAVNAPATIYNDGNCHLSCSFGKQLLGDDLKPGWNLKVELLIIVPGSCVGQDSCPYSARIDCKELQDPGCIGKEYSNEIAFIFINSTLDMSKASINDQTDKAPLDSQINTITTTMNNNPPEWIEVTPSSSQVSGLAEGEKATMKAYLVNNGKCKVKCFYKTQGTNYLEEQITDGLNPGSKANFNIIFFVPEGCTEPCSISAHIKCYDPPDTPNECPNPQTYDADVSFDLVGIRTSRDILLGYILLGAIMLAVGAAIYFILKRITGGTAEAKERFSPKERRRLSAIMFTDVKGFSKSVGQDEEATLRKMWKYEGIMGKIIKRHEGRIVKTIGDAIMGDFDSAVNAVKCAIEIQNTLRKEKFFVRIGIHLGDVIHKGGDVFGDGVNIASRVESIAEAGTVYISDDVYNQVKNKIKAKFQDMGPRTLKNIEHPVKVYKVE